MPIIHEYMQAERTQIIDYRLSQLPLNEQVYIDYLAESLLKTIHAKNPHCKMGRESALELLFSLGRHLNNGGVR